MRRTRRGWPSCRAGARVAAEHYERAGGDEQALVHFEGAVDPALSRYANAAALAHLGRMLANPRAVAAIERILGVPDIDAWLATDLQSALICYRVLAAALDPRAPGVIARAHAALQALAARIADGATRSRVLNNLPYHREIVAAWRALDFNPGTDPASPPSRPDRDCASRTGHPFTLSIM